jgi:hypothetical protein
MFDVVIAYRIYPGVSKIPAYLPEDKFKMAEMCLRSLHAACSGLRFKIYALLDGCPPAYETMFRETFSKDAVEILALNSIGNYATFKLQIELLTKQTESDYVFFAEDDYFYLPGAMGKMLALIRENPDVDFVTPYDHPDSYYTSSRLERHIVRPHGDRHWRHASATCLTFLTSRKTLLSTRRMFESYSRGNPDCSIWLALTQKQELANLRVHWQNRFRVKIWLYTLRWGLFRLLFGRRWRLWSPMPSLATHMESTCLAPVIDWPMLFEDSQHAEGS